VFRRGDLFRKKSNGGKVGATRRHNASNKEVPRKQKHGWGEKTTFTKDWGPPEEECTFLEKSNKKKTLLGRKKRKGSGHKRSWKTRGKKGVHFSP